MTFEEILDQTTEILRRRGRVSSRALRRQFGLDDAALDDLRYELVEVLGVATEVAGVFSYNGESGASPEEAAPPEPEAIATAADPVAGASTERAERRQLTVMFCDLVDSTRLSGQVDPEDFREIVHAYQVAFDRVVERFEGHVSQHVGDGIVAFFGYPAAHEDDARRAVGAGLALFDALEALNAVLSRDKGVTLRIRVGIHTGLVVIGETAGELLALGEAPNVAARILGVADPDTLVISAATHRLVKRFYEVDPLGGRDLRGVERTISLYRVVGEREVEAGDERGRPVFVGRDSEKTLMLERWEQAREGQGQVILVRGEAGIGKSRLVHELANGIEADAASRLVFRCSPYHRNSALQPVIELLGEQIGIERSDAPERRVEKIEAFLGGRASPELPAVWLTASLLSVPARDRLADPGLSPERQKTLTLELLTDWIVPTTEGPVFSVWEDLQWADPSTIELLGRVIDSAQGCPILVVATSRPEFRPSWDLRANLADIVLNPLTRSHVERLVNRLAGEKRLPREVVEEIVARVDGNPMFVEEVTALVLEAEDLTELESEYRLTGSIRSLAIPSTLQDSLMARLDRLGDAKPLAQLGSVIGREFIRDFIAALCTRYDLDCEAGLDRLVASGILLRRGAPGRESYAFKHALLQDAAYASLLRRTRREYHRHIVTTLEERFPESAETEPELLARHCTLAEMPERAIPYWLRAGEQAATRSAHTEAIHHLNRGLEMLDELPDDEERLHDEILLQIALGVPLTALRGYGSPEVERAYSRALELCRQAGEVSHLVPAMYGLWRYNLLRARYEDARELSDRMLELARADDDPAALVVANRASGSAAFYQGRLDTAFERLDAILSSASAPGAREEAALYDVVDAWVTARSYISWTLWLQGHFDRALEQSRAAVALAEEMGHPFSISLARCFAAWFHQFRDEPEVTLESAEIGLDVAEKNGFTFWFGWAEFLQGWAYFRLGRTEEGLDRMASGLAAWHATGSWLGHSYFLYLVATVRAESGQLEGAFTALEEALEFVEETGERFWEAELHRLDGELRLRRDPDAVQEAETCFRRALDLARKAGARALELRAAVSLARLARPEPDGRSAESRDVLEPVLNGFSEGEDQPEIRRARKLLSELEEVG